jgi:ABC-type transport system involved in multi-copper enzyme maturation permease subunit
MSAAIAIRMVGADLLKIRKKYGTLIWSLVLAVLPVVIFFVVNAVEHSSSPGSHEPAGGTEHFITGLRLLGGLFFGPLVAILIGVEAGTSDLGAGVFRDMVVTGRSRLALFASRVPAALLLCWSVILASYALVLVGTYALAGGLATPSASLVLNGLGYLLLSTGVLCAVAVGFSSLVGSKPAAIIALIAWQLVAGALIASISSLGSARDGILYQAISHFSPVNLNGGGHHDHGGPTILTMSGATAFLVLLAWLVVFLGLGSWRTRTMDA